MWLDQICQGLSGYSMSLVTPSIFQKVWQIEPVVQLRPPDVPSLRSQHKVFCLFRSGILQPWKFLTRNQETTTITQFQHQEVQRGLRMVNSLNDARIAFEFLRSLQGGINLFIRRCNFISCHELPPRV